MKNKDIILIFLVIIVLYLLFCDNRKNKEIKELKENFSTTTSSSASSSTSTTINNIDQEIRDKVEQYLAKRKEIPITESIKNLGIIAKKLQEDQFLNLPGDFVIDGDLKVKGKINTDGGITSNNYIYTKGLSTTDNIWIEKEKRIGWQMENGSKIGSYIKGREKWSN